MGNDQSNLPGLEFDSKAVEISNFWALHSATINSITIISLFIGEPLVGGPLWVKQTPLEKATKVLELPSFQTNLNATFILESYGL